MRMGMGRWMGKIWMVRIENIFLEDHLLGSSRRTGCSTKGRRSTQAVPSPLVWTGLIMHNN